jgi:hypothetical protein
MIKEPVYIERKKSGENPDSFESIREKGIQLLQEISGKIWTDYNPHDPGVTILEQLTLALTELIYLSGFDVKDILTTEDNEINYRKLALYKPLEIFPSEAITNKDYCKSIYDNINGIRNIWTINQDHQLQTGLYTFLIDVEKKYVGEENRIIEDIKKYYCSNRNLCEDLEKIEILEREPVEINGIIDIDNEENPDYILANIFFRCFKIITPRMVFHSYKGLIESGMSLEEILTGPEMKNGYIKDEELSPPQKSLYVPELMTNIFRVKGVNSIREFYLEKDSKKIYTSLTFANPLKNVYINFPSSASDLKVRLERNGRACTINFDEMLRKLYQFINNYKSTHNTSQNIANYFSLPKGKYMPHEGFYSIQNHFPAIFGINRFGIPAGSTPERKAKAKQLKGYLLLFEQLMVNFLEQLRNIPELFSIDPELKSTYFTRPLIDVPGINDLLPDNWKKDKDLHQKQLDEIIQKYDNYYERRNRILDFILAMYGENFDSTGYQQFRYYDTIEELPRILCENKLIMLKYLKDINRFKTGTFDYLIPSWNTFSIPGIKFKVSLLLGINNFKQTGYSDVLANYNLQLINKKQHKNYDDYFFNRRTENPDLDYRYIHDHFSLIPYYPGIKNLEQEKIAKTALSVDYLSDGIICEEFFRYGINLNFYKIGKLNRRDYYTVVFKYPREQKYIYIADYADYDEAVLSINCLQKFLIMLNHQSEGMHIVEHILLRQQEGKQQGATLHIKNHTDDPIFSSTKKYSNVFMEGLPDELGQILPDNKHYLIEPNEAEKFTVAIQKNNETIFQGHEVFDTVEEAERAIEAYCIYFDILKEKEKLENKVHAILYSEIPDDFYAHRLSIVLPSWSARFNNHRFRIFVEETFGANLPAHLYPEFYWLDRYQLSHFEKIYKNWLGSKATSNQATTDEYARELIQFLLNNKNETGN